MNTEKPNDLQEASSLVSTPAQEKPFYWTKILPQSSTIDSSYHNVPDTSYEFGKILIEKSDNPTAYEVFEVVTHFNDFLKDIVIPQTELYSQQKGKIFFNQFRRNKSFVWHAYSDGISCFAEFQRLLVHRTWLRCSLHIQHNAFETIWDTSFFFLHFNSNELMKPRADPHHDRLFKVRPVLGHFNKSFLAAMNPTKHQSTDEQMLKFKGNYVLRLYVKGKPIQWGFKMWCKCDLKTGYQFKFDIYAGKKANQVQLDLEKVLYFTWQKS